MKKIYLFLIVSISVINLNAQITLTSSNSVPQIGDSYNYVINSSYTFNLNQNGANQTWDFSAVTGTSTPANYINLANSSLPTTFPTSNIVESSQGGENYLFSSNSTFAYEGHYAPNVMEVIYSDKREILKFPITYNDVYNETFEGTVNSSGSIFNRSGSIEIKADGYGDLTLPYTTVNNVLRVRSILNYNDLESGVLIASYTDTIYSWYNIGTKNYIASAHTVYVSGFQLTSQISYIEQSDIVLDVANSNQAFNQISFYPNPATDYLVLNNTATEEISVNIYDIRGSLVKSVVISGGMKKLNIGNLNPGMYFLKYNKGNISHTEKLIIE